MSWAHVQGGVQDNASGTTNALVLPATVGSGNLVCGIIGWSSGTLTDLTSITDDKGNTYNIVAKVSDDSNWAQAGYWLANITNAPKTITAHFAASVGSIQIGDEFSGGGASATIDKSNTNLQVNPGTGVGAVTSGSVTPAVNGELIYGGSGSTITATPVYSAGTAAGFTQLERDGTTNPVTEFLVQATAAAIAALFTDNTATDHSITTILTFKPTTGNTISQGPTLPNLSISNAVKVIDKIGQGPTLPNLTISSTLKAIDKISATVIMPNLSITSALKALDKISATVAIPNLAISSSIHNAAGSPAATGTMLPLYRRRGRR